MNPLHRSLQAVNVLGQQLVRHLVLVKDIVVYTPARERRAKEEAKESGESYVSMLSKVVYWEGMVGRIR